MILREHLDVAEILLIVHLAFFVGPVMWVPCTVHGTHKSLIYANFSLKLGPTILFTYLKIILLQYFQFLVFSNKQYPNRPYI